MNPLDSISSANTPYKIRRLYLKGASVEVPHMANLPQQAMSPQVGVDMQTEATPAGPGALECVLRISLHAKLEGRNVFMIEVSEAGVFELDLSNMEDAHRFVRQIAPSVLFPFARKDLASLAVSAGFQPVLLDHVDFDALLAQVIKSQRRTRVSAPMRVDVIAAKPTATTAPPPIIEAQTEQEESVIQEDPASDWHDTLPAPMAVEMPTALTDPTIQSDQKKNKSLRMIITALLGLASFGAMVVWRTEPNVTTVPRPSNTTVPQPEVETRTPAPPASTTPATLPIPAVTSPATVIPKQTQTALATSRARLAEQPKTWFTLDLGVVPAGTPLTKLTPLLPDRPLFILTNKDGNLRVLSGVFPSKVAAELMRNQLQQSASLQGHQAATVVSIGSL